MGAQDVASGECDGSGTAVQDVLAEVLSVEPLPLPYYALHLKVPAAFGVSAPGQFVMAMASPSELRLKPFLRRAFSVFDQEPLEGATNGERHIQLFGKIIGPGTSSLAECRPGDEVAVLGPLGVGFTLPSRGRAALVAGGVGSAALLLLQRALSERSVEHDFLYGGRSTVDLAASVTFAELARRSGGRYLPSTEDGSTGHHGLITEVLAEGLAESRYQHVFTCGPEGLMRAVARLAAAHDCPGQAALETAMGCGYGACLGCAVQMVNGEIQLCCKHGPVFDLAEVSW